MAATWRAVTTAIAFANAKDMLNVFNGGSSARIIRAYRAYIFNNQTSGVTGVLTTMQIRRITSASSGTGVTPVKHDTNSGALDANTTCGTNQTVGGSDVFRRFLWSNDEPAVSGATMDEWELMVPFCEVWSAGYGDTNIEPIVCRVAEGFEIYHSGSTAVGLLDPEIEFTDSAT